MVAYQPVAPSGIKRAMKDDHWTELCQQASVEEDPEKLMHLINEINRLLDDKERRPRPEPPKTEDVK